LTLKELEGALELLTARLARRVEISGNIDGDEFGWGFEDNFFNLLPGQTKQVKILGKHRFGTVSAKPFSSYHVATIKTGAT